MSSWQCYQKSNVLKPKDATYRIHCKVISYHFRCVYALYFPIYDVLFFCGRGEEVKVVYVRSFICNISLLIASDCGYR